MSNKLLPESSNLMRSSGAVSPHGQMAFEDISLISQDFTLVDFLKVLRKRKWIVLGSVVILLALTLTKSLMMTPMYESVSRIETGKENENSLGLDELIGGIRGGGSENTRIQTQVKILQSDSLALRVIQDLHLESRKPYASLSNPVNEDSKLPLESSPIRRSRVLGLFRRNLEIKTVPNTEMIEIRFLDPNPQVSADVPNALVNAYKEHTFRARYAAAAQASDWLSQEIEDLKTQTEASQKKLVQYQKETGILGGDEANNVIIAKLETLNKQLTEAEAARISRQSVYQLVKTGNAEIISGLAGTNIGSGSLGNSLTLIQNLRSRESELKGLYAQAATKYGAAFPRLVQMKNQLAEIEANIQTEIKKVEARAENDYRVALKTESMLQISFDRQKQEANKLNLSAIQFMLLKREAESSRDLYEGLSKKLKEAGVVAGLKSTNINVIDPALPPAKPVKPDIPMNLGLGLIAGLMGGVFLAFIVENTDHTLQTPDQIEMISDLPVFGIIPNGTALNGLKKSKRGKEAALPAPGEPLSAIVDSKSQMAEVYRALRTSVLLSNVDEPPKVILFTSALPGEGKTTTSVNFAAVLAQQGARVLLLEADMRRPAFQNRMGLHPGAGLSSLLASTNGVQAAIAAHPNVPNLFVLPSGSIPPYPADLLGSNRMAESLARWRNEFEFVIMDSPPVLVVTDAMVLSSRADAVVVVVRAGQSTRQSVIRTCEMLRRVRARLTGVVINAVDLNSSDHYNYYGYRYDSKYGSEYLQGTNKD